MWILVVSVLLWFGKGGGGRHSKERRAGKLEEWFLRMGSRCYSVLFCESWTKGIRVLGIHSCLSRHLTSDSTVPDCLLKFRTV